MQELGQPNNPRQPNIGKRMKAINKVFLGQENKGRGRYFKSRFIEAGLVQYDFGLCLLTKENLDKFVQGFVGCPVIIDHNEVYDDNAEDLRVGTVSRVWFDETDGYYWCEGIIWDEKALDLILNKGWSVSCQYDITEIDEQGGIHNGIEFDKTILNGSFEHLALVDAPRYEAALIAVNSAGKKKFLYNKAINSNFKEEEHPRGDDGKFTSGSDSNILENTDFGTAYTEYSHKPKEAIEHLLTHKNGYVPAAIYKDKIGDIDFVYGKNGKDGYGLAHIIERRNQDGDDGESFVKQLPEIIEQGEVITKSGHKGRKYITTPDKEVAIRLDYNGEERNWIVSAYILKNKAKNILTQADTGFRTLGINYPDEQNFPSSDLVRITNIITDIQSDFNPDITKHKAQNSKEIDMGIIEDLEKLILKARNKGENMKSKNEETDKRKLIDEIAGMMKSAGADDELIRTAIGKMEKLAYDKSEAGTADNKAKNEDEDDENKEEAKNKCRNEEDEEEKPKNKRGKNEDDEEEDEYDKLKREVDDEAKNKAKNKARNSINDFKKSFYDYNSGSYGTGYISQKKAIELGKQIF